MRKLVFSLGVLPLAGGVAFAAEPLMDAQMDLLTAGALPSISIACPGCIASTSSSSNGVTIANPAPGAGSSDNTGNSGNSNSGNAGSLGNFSGPVSSNSVVPVTFQLPRNFLEVIATLPGYAAITP